MNWFDGLLVFEKVATHKSFSQAARELNLLTAVVTNRIQWLEKQLNMALFIRTTRLVVLTETGAALLQRIKPLLDEWTEIQKSLLDQQDEPEGELSICLLPNISGTPFFINALQAFIKKYPKIKLSITTTVDPVNLIQKKIDIFLGTERYVLDPKNTVGVKLVPFLFQCCGSPEYLLQYGTPKAPTDLNKHNCLIFRSDYHWDFSDSSVPVGGNWQTDSGDCIALACMSGIGLGFLPSFMIQEAVKNGKLKIVLNTYSKKKHWLNLFYVKTHYKPKKIELFIAFMREHLS